MSSTPVAVYASSVPHSITFQAAIGPCLRFSPCHHVRSISPPPPSPPPPSPSPSPSPPRRFDRSPPSAQHLASASVAPSAFTVAVAIAAAPLRSIATIGRATAVARQLEHHKEQVKPGGGGDQVVDRPDRQLGAHGAAAARELRGHRVLEVFMRQEGEGRGVELVGGRLADD